MTNHMILPAALGLAMLAAPAMAAMAAGSGANHDRDARKEYAMTPPKECLFLQQKFDLGIKTHGNDMKAAEARNLRTEGANLCNAGNTEQGISKLKQALNDIDVSTVED